MRILQSCSSALLRNNGIYKFMNEIAIFAGLEGHSVDLLTDSTPIVNTSQFQQVICHSKNSSYVPNTKDGHPWLQFEKNLVIDLMSLYINKYDLILIHDLHSAVAFEKIDKTIFILHESDILNTTRFSYLDDDYLKMQKAIKMKIGDPFGNTPPIMSVTDTERTYGDRVLYIGDASYRKGLDTFIDVATKLKLPTCMLCPEHGDYSRLYDNLFVSLPGHKVKEKIEFFKNARVCLFPSRSETFSYAVLEALVHMPVILDAKYSWTANLAQYGAIVSNDLEKDVAYWYENYESYDNTKLLIKLEDNKSQWRQLLSLFQ